MLMFHCKFFVNKWTKMLESGSQLGVPFSHIYNTRRKKVNHDDGSHNKFHNIPDLSLPSHAQNSPIIMVD